MPPVLRTTLPTELTVENIRKEKFEGTEEDRLFQNEIVYAHIIREKIFVPPDAGLGDAFTRFMMKKFRDTIASKFPDIVFIFEVDSFMLPGNQYWFHVTGVGYKIVRND